MLRLTNLHNMVGNAGTEEEKRRASILLTKQSKKYSVSEDELTEFRRKLQREQDGLPEEEELGEWYVICLGLPKAIPRWINLLARLVEKHFMLGIVFTAWKSRDLTRIKNMKVQWDDHKNKTTKLAGHCSLGTGKKSQLISFYGSDKSARAAAEAFNRVAPTVFALGRRYKPNAEDRAEFPHLNPRALSMQAIQSYKCGCVAGLEELAARKYTI